MSRTKSGPTLIFLVAFFAAMTVTPSSSEAQSDMSPMLRSYERQGPDASKQLQQQSNQTNRLLQQKKNRNANVLKKTSTRPCTNCR
jgi:hypothetical protein